VELYIATLWALVRRRRLVFQADPALVRSLRGHSGVLLDGPDLGTEARIQLQQLTYALEAE
jgi:hypothetical protein